VCGCRLVEEHEESSECGDWKFRRTVHEVSIGAICEEAGKTDNPNSKGNVEEILVITDGVDDERRSCTVFASVDIESKEKTTEDVVMRRTAPKSVL